MGFTDFVSGSGLTLLDKWVQTRSYINGYSPSQADVVSFKAVTTPPAVETFPNAHRWYNHIKSYEPEFPTLPGDPSKAYTTYGPEDITMAVNPKKAPTAEEAGDEDEDIDLFGSDEEEEDPEVVAEREKRLAEYRKKKEGKAKPVAKSVVTLDIKGYVDSMFAEKLGTNLPVSFHAGDETDMDELKASVLEIEMDGLTWGASKFVPVGYGIKKLHIILVVEDEKVSLDELETRLVDDLSDLVQSMDVVAMQKL